MSFRARQWTEMAAMAAISALVYVEFFRLNNYLFTELEHVPGVSWIFLPAGFRVLMVLGMGWSGALGIVLGNCWLDQASLTEESLWLVLATAAVSGLTPLCVRWVMEKKLLLARQLQDFTAQNLMQFVLAYAVANALAHHAVWWALKRPGSHLWLDIWPMFVGDAVGAMVVLYTLKLMLPALSGWATKLKA